MVKKLLWFGVLASVCSVPSSAFAQSPPEWTLGIRLGKPLFVTLQNGERLEGVAGSVTGEGIGVATPIGVRTAAFSDIRKVERRDSPWNGVWIGAGAGTALGLAAALDDDTCPDNARGCEAEAGVLPIAGAVDGQLVAVVPRLSSRPCGPLGLISRRAARQAAQP
ncbi:MAG TPA: hypothetical protein VNJ03_05730 [Vicinamibacterales bacterium]|nr:hypothetical protein [Vicinamibacterales bacterium]